MITSKLKQYFAVASYRTPKTTNAVASYRTPNWTGCIAVAVTVFALLAFAPVAEARVPVVASIPELADITREIGGGLVSVISIAKPNQDYHTIEASPDSVRRISQARLVVRTGLDLDMWMDALLNAAGNRDLNRGGNGYVDASAGLISGNKLIEIPTDRVNGASGDIHIYGNPHYFYDPIYGIFAAQQIVKGLIRVDEAHAATYRAGYSQFKTGIQSRMKGWQQELAPYAGHPVVTYHLNYDYFLRRFGLRFYGSLEPKPGVPPSAEHLNALIRQMKKDHVRALIIESIYPTRGADLVSHEVGIHYVRSPYSVGSMGTHNYFELIDTIVSSFKQALSQ